MGSIMTIQSLTLITTTTWVSCFGPLETQQSNKIVCYYTSWAVYRENASMYPKDIDPFLCTHILFAFAVIDDEGQIKAHDPDDVDVGEGGKGRLREVSDLKLINPDLKVMIAIGGWNMGTAPFEKATADDTAMGKFVHSIMNFINKYNYDGVDLDWEFPVGRAKQFTKLCQALKQAFQTRNLLLSAAVSAGIGNINQYYEPDKICSLLDFVNVMTYDFHGQWDTSTQGITHHSPLNWRSDEHGWMRDFNVRSAADAWLSSGCPRQKIIIGIPLYGQSFRLIEPNKHGFGDPAKCGPIGPVRKSNEWAFFEVCHAQQNGHWKKGWHNEHEIPFMYNNETMVTYDNPRSGARKAVFVKYNGYGGAMFWTLDFDDFNGRYCGHGTFPVIRTVKCVLNMNLSP